MNVKLIVVGGKTNKGEVSPVIPLIIGRSRDAGLTVAHSQISRQHCELFEADGRLKVRNLDSMNGTFVDKRRIAEAPLPPGAILSVGPLSFRVDYEPKDATDKTSITANMRVTTDSASVTDSSTIEPDRISPFDIPEPSGGPQAKTPQSTAPDFFALGDVPDNSPSPTTISHEGFSPFSIDQDAETKPADDAQDEPKPKIPPQRKPPKKTDD